jgi:Na+/melibiose symporter-like transporter
MKLFQTFEGDKIPKRTKWIYSVSAVGRDACYALVSLFLLTFIQFSGVLTPAGAGIDGGQYAAMFAVISALVIGYRIFDALNDPFMGVIVEKVHSKFGKYKPWILIGCLTNSVVVFCLFCVPQWVPALQGWGYVGWFACFYLLWGLTYTMNDVAYWAMLPSLSSDEKERTSVTTMMQIFCSVGQFAVAGLTPILSGSFGYQNTYMWVSIAVIVAFMVLQVILFFCAKEHTRDVEAEKTHKPPSFKDMFSILKNNDQVRWSTIIILIYYIGSGILNALGINYFYFSINFTVGSSVMTYFTIVYGLGVIVATFLFPFLSKKFTRAQLLRFCIILTVIGYCAFFVYGLPIGGGNYLSPNPLNSDGSLNILYLIPMILIGLCIFFAQGLIGLILVMQNANTIEYNEWKFGERKESVIFSLRSLNAKMSSAVQQAVLYIFLASAGLLTVVSQLSNYQQELAMGTISQDVANNLSNSYIASNVEVWQVVVYKIGVAIIPMILLVVAYILIKKHYKIDEKMYNQMVKEIKERKETSTEESIVK